MRKYDFEKMGGIWKDDARKITENGINKCIPLF